MPSIKIVEAVTAGHPDKICDQIADALMDEYLRRDPATRGKIEVFGSHGMIAVGGSVVSRADFDCAAVARQTYADIVRHNDAEVFVNIGITRPETGLPAGQAGFPPVGGTAVVHGYATRETRECLPRAVVLAQALARRLDDLRRSDAGFHWLNPDGHVQIVCRGKDVSAVTLFFDQDASATPSEVRERCLAQVIEPILGNVGGVRMLVNPYGVYKGGELTCGSGASGRKTDADTYGGLIPHGGGAISGKEPLSPDRAGLYAARQAAKSIVAAGLATQALVTIAYALGRSEPVAVEAKSGDGKDFTELVTKYFDLRLEAIVERLGLARPIYRDFACYGQFGRIGAPWEEVVSLDG